MRWRDIKTEPMTAADGDDRGFVLQQLTDGHINSFPWHNRGGVVSWMPLSELPKFTPVPDPPDGWRLVVAGDAFDKRAQMFARGNWVTTVNNKDYSDAGVYIIPIDPPKPTYRPFANAAEFEPYSSKRWRFKGSSSDYRRMPANFGDTFHSTATWKKSLETKVFCDGTPFGVKQ